ncbi:histidine phosphatase family protein [Cohnella hashimotonis]|uniref:Histidine phosphatase family protein n=1 Tax=Cohnella hashimotonis TaxID=2826895 RepID=A0ABT6TM54_9BACL|nr:histidine phosphatase family protein [Cohnella hashimotonis]MDI4646917.1 histidine phosphatase family protein [Cohnella hashimotonis]
MLSKTIIYLVRHGQTEWNVEQRMQGHQDSPLTKLGISQAEWLEEALRQEPIDAAYSSSSRRARRTAEIVMGKRELHITDCDDFKEISLGAWEGKTQSELNANDPEQLHYFWNDPAQFYVLGSERFEDVQCRAIQKLNEIVHINEGRSILIVTHTVVVKLIMAYFEKRPLQELWNLPYIHPASLCKIVIENNNAEIMLHGDIKHYKEEPSVG